MISIVQLGTVDYATGLNLQQQLVALRKENKIGDVLLLLEHKPVITLGRNAKAANVVASPELLRKRGVELFECDRGGDVTFHGPGQLVGYPIFDLRGYARSSTNLNDLSSRASRSESDGEPRDLGSSSTFRKTMGVIEFVRRLEEVLIRTCADFTIPSKRLPGLTGAWTNPAQQSSPMDSHALSSRAKENDPRKADRSLQPRDLGLADATKDHVATAASAGGPESKIAAIGVHISRAVTSHGFALNVNTDLSYFNLIIPCGITTKPVTSMQQELGRTIDLNAVAESISRNFGVVFQSQILWLDSLDHLLCGAGTSVKKGSSRTVKSDVEERPFKGRVSRES